jgi:glycosyltransferase involved in cell wall biosynthesis
MRIMFVLDYSYPSPTASSNRIASLAKALNSKNNKVDILCILGTFKKESEATGSTDYASVKASATFYRHPGFFQRNIDRMAGFFNAYRIVRSENKKEKIDFIFLPPKKNIFNTKMYFIAKMLGIKLLQERSEFPEIYIKSLSSRISYFYYKKVILPLLDGMVVMTDTLKKYYSDLISSKAAIVTIPMSVDLNRFETFTKNELSEKYIAYCGNISNRKDGVDILVKAFGLVSPEFPDYSLYLIGSSDDKGLLTELEQLCRELSIEGKVVFTGKAGLNEIPNYLNNAQVLALARPSSLQAAGGFPTKLGEYLATKNPVVVTNVGEIGNYLRDGESAFISEPDSAEAFASKLRECLGDYERSKKIGLKGYEVAKSNFDYKSQAEMLNLFLEDRIVRPRKNKETGNLKIAVITQAAFPVGLASTNRVTYHAKGLVANGVETKVFLTWPTERGEIIRNKEGTGIANGITFEYPNKRSVRSKYFLQRRIDDILGPFRVAFNLWKNRYDAAIMVSWNSFYDITMLKILLSIFGIKLLAERTELPFHNKKQHGWHKIKNRIILTYAYKNLYGFLAISRNLKKLFETLVSKKCPVILYPVVIDDRDIYKPEVPRTRNLVYTGPLVQSKDGILTIIEAFTQIAQEFSDTNLIMTGNIDKSPDKEKIMELINNTEFKRRIELTGFISREKMIDYLNSAAGLLMAKPTGLQADTCFPTRLGEYLATGNPIVVTGTGEIPFYLKDGFSAYISEPDSTEAYASKLRELLSDPVKAKEIGIKGRETAIEKFNYRETSKKVITLVTSTKKYKEIYED